MDDGLTLEEVKRYKEVVIPKIQSSLVDSSKSADEKVELYNLYKEVLRILAPHDFASFNMYIEFEEDHTDKNKGFYWHRKDHLKEIIDALNDMEVNDEYDMLLISCPPRVGKTTLGIRFLSWITGRYPEYTQLATSYSDNITSSFYIGVNEIVQSQAFKDVFPDAPLVNQNAKRQEIWLKVVKRYPSIMFIPIEGSMTGRGDAKQYLYCDDLVSGLEQALSVTRLEKLWGLYTVNAKQRKSDGCKEIHIATRWSVHDPITKLANDNENNPRCKIISIPCFNDEGESNFDFYGGFSTKYYKDLQGTMDEASFGALYECNPIEREGLLYHKEDLQYYFELPKERPDSIIGICDSKNLGVDFVSAISGYVYGDLVYIEDVVYDKSLPEITRPRVADLWFRNNVVRADVEMNNGGNYYAEELNKIIKSKGGKTSIRMFYSSNNKNVKIVTYSDYVTKQFVFKDQSMYSKNSDYAEFMKAILSWTQLGNNKHDDACDAIAMLAQLAQELQGSTIKILNRRTLGI